MKKVMLSIRNSLMLVSITRVLKGTGGFLISSIPHDRKEIARECAEASADILLMEAGYEMGTTLDNCLYQVKLLRSFCPKCRVILLCDENSTPEIARRVAQAKRDGLIDDFVYSSVSESYLTAMLYAI